MIHLVSFGRLLAASALVALIAPPATAQRRITERRGEFRLDCSRDRGDWDYERFCDITETTIPAPGGSLNIDGRTNGGVTVIGSSRRDVLVRAMIQANARSAARARAAAEA